MDGIRRRIRPVQQKCKDKMKPSGWLLPQQKSSFADDGTWTNVDMDVTPLERRVWGPWTMLGFWFSDALNAQGWEAPAAIIAGGLTW